MMSVSELLVHHIDVLRRQHRSGINPTFGQIDELFELSDQLRLVNARIEPQLSVPRCTYGQDCPRESTMTLRGKPYCQKHGQIVRDVLEGMHELAPDMVRTTWPQAESRAAANG